MTPTPPPAVTTDVVIVGAGPAGAAAAITLAQAGRSAIVVDKATFPRDKFCGDGLTSGALRLLEGFGVVPDDVPSWMPVEDVYIQSPSGHRAHFPLPKGRGQYAAITTRLDLDNALVTRARAAGADIRDGHSCIAVTLRDDHVLVEAEGIGTIKADFLIAADGMWSTTRKLIGLRVPDYRGDWHAFRQYWTGVGPRAARELHVWFEADVLPGYVWSFPLPNGQANIGFGIHRDTHAVGDMKQYWPSILDRPHIREIIGDDAEPTGPHRAWPIPARLGSMPLTAARTMFVGDAAAACDPMTGEGIAQALETGALAATCVIDGGTEAARANPSQVTRRYEDELHRALETDLRFAAWLGQMLRSAAGARSAVRIASLTQWTSENFARWLFEDYPRALLGTPHRWRRDMFSQPGSYLARSPTSAGLRSSAGRRHPA